MEHLLKIGLLSFIFTAVPWIEIQEVLSFVTLSTVFCFGNVSDKPTVLRFRQDFNISVNTYHFTTNVE